MSEISREDATAGLQEAADRMGLDLSDIQEMIDDTIEDAHGKAKQLVNLIAEGQSNEVKVVAHDIKGTCLNFGLNEPAKIAKKMEDEPEGTENSTLVTELVKVLEHLKGLGLGK